MSKYGPVKFHFSGLKSLASNAKIRSSLKFLLVQYTVLKKRKIAVAVKLNHGTVLSSEEVLKNCTN